jgi:hypothetical protein
VLLLEHPSFVHFVSSAYSNDTKEILATWDTHTHKFHGSEKPLCPASSHIEKASWKFTFQVVFGDSKPKPTTTLLISERQRKIMLFIEGAIKLEYIKHILFISFPCNIKHPIEIGFNGVYLAICCWKTGLLVSKRNIIDNNGGTKKALTFPRVASSFKLLAKSLSTSNNFSSLRSP